MGERGPAPEPLALRLLKNTNHKPINDQSPSLLLPAEAPDCPEWIYGDEDAVAEWVELVTIMEQVPGWLTRVNKSTLAGHCHWYSVWKNAEKVLAEEGRFYNSVMGLDEDGQEIGIVKKLHPMNKVSKEAWAAMVVCDKELGITPARGSSVHVPHGDSKDEQGLDGVG